VQSETPAATGDKAPLASGVSKAMIGGIAGAVAAVIAAVAVFVIVFTIRRKRASNDGSQLLDPDPAYAHGRDPTFEEQDFAVEQVNPNIETFQGEVGFTTVHGSDDALDD
jgi:hypothetical protein